MADSGIYGADGTGSENKLDVLKQRKEDYWKLEAGVTHHKSHPSKGFVTKNLIAEIKGSIHGFIGLSQVRMRKRPATTGGRTFHELLHGLGAAVRSSGAAHPPPVTAELPVLIFHPLKNCILFYCFSGGLCILGILSICSKCYLC